MFITIKGNWTRLCNCSSVVMLTTNSLFQLCFLYHSLITGLDGWVIFQFISQRTHLQRPYVGEFTNVLAYSLINYVQANSSISTTGAISIYFNVLKDIPTIHAKAIFNLERINKAVNGCEFLRNRKYEPLLQFFLQNFD